MRVGGKALSPTEPSHGLFTHFSGLIVIYCLVFNSSKQLLPYLLYLFFVLLRSKSNKFSLLFFIRSGSTLTHGFTLFCFSFVLWLFLSLFCLLMSCYVCMLACISLTQRRVIWEERASVEELPPSDWPVALYVEHLFAFSLMEEGSPHWAWQARGRKEAYV